MYLEMQLDIAYLAVGLFASGMGVIFLWADRYSPPSRALAYCLLAIGARLFLSAVAGDVRVSGYWTSVAAVVLEAVSMVAGIGWARRIGKTADVPLRTTTQWLFHAGQIFTIVYGLMAIAYLTIAPEEAARRLSGALHLTQREFALFAPVVSISLLCSAVAIVMLLLSGIDKSERVRLFAAFVAGPFLAAALIVSDSWVPLTITIGLLIFLAGSVQYLMVQGQRGEFMSQFLSPDVARMVRAEGIKKALRRQRRPVTVVVCDLRGFTAFAREHDSHDVADVLEIFYDVVGSVAEKHSGTVKDHAGDGVLILVGAPIPVAEHARQAALLALELIRRSRTALDEAGITLGVGVGVATGKATVGAIRGAGRFEYVAVGTVVNLAARLCDRAEDGEILADKRTIDALIIDDPVLVEEREPERLKGFEEPVPVAALWIDPERSAALAPLPPPKRRRRRKRSKRRRASS